jgi:hypothetical protein
MSFPFRSGGERQRTAIMLVVMVPAVRAFRPREEHRSAVPASGGQLHLEDPRRRVPPAVRLALAVLQEQEDQPVPVVLTGTATHHDIGLIRIGGCGSSSPSISRNRTIPPCCTRRHIRLPSVPSR